MYFVELAGFLFCFGAVCIGVAIALVGFWFGVVCAFRRLCDFLMDVIGR